MVNGGQSSFLKASRGLRHDDPLPNCGMEGESDSQSGVLSMGSSLRMYSHSR